MAYQPVMLRHWGQTNIEAKFLALALTSWPQPQAFGFSLASVFITWPQKMCYTMQNNISCIHFTVVSLQFASHEAAPQQLHRYLTEIKEASDPTVESSHLDKLSLDFPLLQPLFAQLFCVPASFAPIESYLSEWDICVSL